MTYLPLSGYIRECPAHSGHGRADRLHAAVYGQKEPRPDRKPARLRLPRVRKSSAPQTNRPTVQTAAKVNKRKPTTRADAMGLKSLQ